MSVAYILNQDYSYVENEKLNPALEVGTSLKAPIHYIEDLTIKKVGDNMVLDCPVVEATVVQSDSVIANSGVFTSAVNPLDGDTTISVSGNVDMSTNGIQNLSSLTVDGSQAVAGYVLSTTDDQGTLAWVDAPSSATPTLSEVLTAGNTASTNINMNLQQIQNCATLRVNNVNNVSGTGQINLNCNLNFGNPTQNTIFAGRLNSSIVDASNQAILGRAPNRFTGANAYAMNYIDNSNIFKSDSVADLIDFHDFKSNRGKIYIVDGSNNEKFSADDTGLIKGSKVETPLIQPSTGQSGTVTIDAYCNITNQLQAQQNIRTKAIYMDRASQFQGSFLQMFDKNNNATISLVADDASGQINCGQLNPTYKPERTLWVSPNNTNANPSGSYENPYSTIQSAINYAESQYNNTYWYINVQAGAYTEDLTITKKVFIKGSAPANPDANSVGCQLNGSITVSVDSNDADMFNNVVSISNMFISGSVECNSGNTARSVLILTDCYIYQDSGNGRLIHYNPDATDGRLWMFNCRLLDQSTSATLPVIEIDKGMLKMLQCAIVGSGNENILKLGSTARIDSIVLCSFTSQTTSTTAAPIVEISSDGAVLSFNQCAFIYSNPADKSASTTSCGILLNNSLAGFFPTMNIQNCAFSLLGTSPSTNYAIEDANAGTAKQAIILQYGNNSIINTAYQVRGTYGVNKFANQTSDAIKTPLLDTTNILASNSVGTAGQYLQKDGSNNLVWGSGGGGGGSATLSDVLTNGNIASTSINMNNNDITNVKDLYPTDINVGSSTGTANQVLGKNSSNVLSWIDQSGGGAFSPTQTLFVDAGNTSGSPDGTINNPYTDISTAVAYAEANFDVNKYWVVNIAPGSYSGFTLSKARIYFQGYNENSNYITNGDAPCKITGDVNISIQTASGTNPIISFSNLYFQNCTIWDRSATGASNQSYLFYLNNCQMENTTAGRTYLIQLVPNSIVFAYIDNCRFSNTASTAMTRMIELQLQYAPIYCTNSVFYTTQNNVCLFGGAISTFEDIRNNTFINTTTNSTPQPLIQLSTNRSNPCNVSNNQFIFTSATGRVANSRGILMAGAQFQLQCNLVGNFFNLGGFSAGNSFVAGDGSPAAANGCKFNYANNTSALNTTNVIEGVLGQGKDPLLSVS